MMCPNGTRPVSGIPPYNIDQIFDPYFTTKDVGKGTGMGLAVVHGIVKEHNGVITVESEPGKGATFGIFFPAVERKAAVDIETREEFPTGNERILFVDDEKQAIKMSVADYIEKPFDQRDFALKVRKVLDEK